MHHAAVPGPATTSQVAVSISDDLNAQNVLQQMAEVVMGGTQQNEKPSGFYMDLFWAQFAFLRLFPGLFGQEFEVFGVFYI